MRLLFAAVVLAALGVVGYVLLVREDDSFTRTEIEKQVGDSMREGIQAEGGTMDNLECVQDGDDTHWRCLTVASSADGERYRVTVTVTCDRGSRECLREPGTVIPLGEG